MNALDLLGKVLSSPQFWTGVANAVAGTWTAVLTLRARKAAKDSKAHAAQGTANQVALDVALEQIKSLSEGFDKMVRKQEETEAALTASKQKAAELEQIVKHVTISYQTEIKKNSRLLRLNNAMATRIRARDKGDNK